MMAVHSLHFCYSHTLFLSHLAFHKVCILQCLHTGVDPGICIIIAQKVHVNFNLYAHKTASVEMNNQRSHL